MLALNTTLPVAVSVSITFTTDVLFVVASSKIVLAATPVKYGASLTPVTPIENVFVTESLPPPVVPPLSFITTVIVFVPIALVAVRNVNVPFVLMLGAVANVKFVPLLSVNVKVCALSFVGPVERPVRKFTFVIVPPSSATKTRLVLSVNTGTSFTALTVNRKLFVLVALPSLATTVMLRLPTAFVFGLNVSV
jgi:hypothetical protein